MIRITQDGGPFDATRFMKAIEAEAIEAGMEALIAKARGAAASIVDPGIASPRVYLAHATEDMAR